MPPAILLSLSPFDSVFLLGGLCWLLTTVFWIVELVDVLRRRFRDSTTKLIWVLIIIFTHVLGALIYYFVGKKQGTLPGEDGAA